jgi:hypothetical protein
MAEDRKTQNDKNYLVSFDPTEQLRQFWYELLTISVKKNQERRSPPRVNKRKLEKMYKLISIQFQSFHMYVYISSGVKSQIVGPTYMQWLIPFHVVTRETTTVHGEFDLVFGHS